MTPTTAGGNFMRGGDVNGDGYGDMAQSGYWTGSPASYDPARVYHGGPTGLSATPSWSHGGAGTVGNCATEPCLAGLGGVNGDGFATSLSATVATRASSRPRSTSTSEA